MPHATQLVGPRIPALPLALPFAIGLLLLAVVFGPKLARLGTVYLDSDYSHGLLIPLIGLYLLWARLPRLRQEPGTPSWWGLPLLAAGCAAVLIAELGAMSKVPLLAAILALAGLTWTIFGWRRLVLAAAPLCMLVLMFPITPYYLVIVTTKLQFVSSELAARLLEGVGVPVYLDGNVIDLGGYQLMVAEACSGLRYLMPLLCIAGVLAYLVRGSWLLRVALVVVTVPITIVLNSLRIMLTGLFMEWGRPDLAEGIMHLVEGWILFLVALLALGAFVWAWHCLATRRLVGIDDTIDFSRIEGDHIRFASNAPDTARLPTSWAPPLVALVLVAATLATGVGLQGRTPYAPERTPLIAFPLALGDWRGRVGTLEPAVIRALEADDHLYVDYVRPGGTAPVNLWVAYYASQTDGAGRGIHSPAVCLPGAGWEYVTFATHTIQPAGAAAPFDVNRGIVSDGRQRMLIYYWFELRGRKVTNETELRLLNLWDSLRERRSDGALVRLITPILANEEPAAADARLRDLLDDAQRVLDDFLG